MFSGSSLITENNAPSHQILVSSVPGQLIKMDDQVDDSSVLPTSKQTLSGIRELSIRCRDLLNQMATLDSITDAADARDIMTSFNIWAANLGIFDEGRLSVAYRLKDAPQVSQLTEKLLIELERYLGN